MVAVERIEPSRTRVWAAAVPSTDCESGQRAVLGLLIVFTTNGLTVR